MKRIASIALALLLTAGMVSFAQLSATEKKKKTSLSQSLNKVKDKRNALRKQLNAKRAEVGDAMDAVHAVDNKMSSVQDQLDKTERELESAKREQQKLATELREQTEKLEQIKIRVGHRIRAMYVQGDGSPIALLSESENLSDLAARKALLERIADKDREIFTEARVLRDTVLAKKKERDAKVIQVAALIEQRTKQLAELESVRAEKKAMFASLKAEENDLEDRYDDMLKESQKLEAQIAALQAKASGSTPIFSGKFILPVNGRFSSGFGYRVHPISGVRKMHTGQDIAAPSGTAIKAAGSGKVITAAYLNGYGNTVVIDHGGGVSTLYGHCSRLFVSVGQTVSQGQKIAAVGSTGYSTGPHLHFEVRINGKPVNPLGRI
ncbi:MAG: peptidoglycan DD-metalloendopeptidase family protein [Armatimonadetes bacterium]|nr:peptidoglycan DD-metalloendopeptidase family protein [Armatimonadota bacterium]MBS1710902.1 peptidoglycan DD-metalloendopeptidase family protein [Armatimonadota bacterium]MBX3108574.1 peptidoglycan DD-metalloendopeptidase family protein [Fimbriimonadaceae bacterium]